MKYLMAVPSANQGAGYVIATGRPVLYLGGFGGQDQVETPDSLAGLVAGGELRYVYEGGGMGGRGGQSGVTSWVAGTCKIVQYDTTATQGSAGTDGRGNTRFGGGQGTLYDCQAN